MEFEVGDYVIRWLGGQIPMKLQIGAIEDGVVYCPVPQYEEMWRETRSDGLAWKFDLSTGAEIDTRLGWGPAMGRTGSYIEPAEKS